MFLKAGALSLVLLLASRLLGLARESAQAATFGASGVADVVVLMLTLPDWLAGVLASGALAYVLVPAWAGQGATQVRATQRRLTVILLLLGVALGLVLALWREPFAAALAGGLPTAMLPAAAAALAWSALALPAALLAALWTTRLQHERDFIGMYCANLVVNAALIAAIAAAALAPSARALHWLGAGLVAAMLLRLGWLHWRTPPAAAEEADRFAASSALPGPPLWLWAALSAGLPLALPFAARSIASQSGPGALAIFNYAWKLVELPLILAVQLVAALAFPIIARALASGEADSSRSAVRGAFALAWALACGAAAALWVGSPAIAGLLFGWGRMDAQALVLVAQWGALGAWSLLPQSLIAVALTVLATQGRMKIAVAAYGAALAAVLLAAGAGFHDGGRLMLLIDLLMVLVALALLAGLGGRVRHWLPMRAMSVSGACMVLLAGLGGQLSAGAALGFWMGLAVAAIVGLAVVMVTWWASADLRAALAR